MHNSSTCRRRLAELQRFGAPIPHDLRATRAKFITVRIPGDDKAGRQAGLEPRRRGLDVSSDHKDDVVSRPTDRPTGPLSGAAGYSSRGMQDICRSLEHLHPPVITVTV